MTLTPVHAAHLQRLAARLDDLRAQRAFSQHQLADRMQTDPATVCRLLQGSDAKASTVLAAIDALGCELLIQPKPTI